MVSRATSLDQKFAGFLTILQTRPGALHHGRLHVWDTKNGSSRGSTLKPLPTPSVPRGFRTMTSH